MRRASFPLVPSPRCAREPREGACARATLPSTSGGTRVQCDRSSTAAPSPRGQSVAEPMAAIRPSRTVSSARLWALPPRPSMRLPAIMYRVSFMGCCLPLQVAGRRPLHGV